MLAIYLLSRILLTFFLNNLRPGERDVSSCFQIKRRLIRLSAPVSDKMLCIVLSVAFSRYKDAFSLAARLLLFCFFSYIDYSFRFCSDLRFLYVDYRRLLSRLRIRYRYSRFCAITSLRFLDRLSLAFFGYCLFPSKSSSEQYNCALFYILLLSRKLLAVSTFLTSAQFNRK